MSGPGGSNTAISCTGVWKSYRIYHQRSHTLKEKVLVRRNRYDDFWALRGVDLEVPAGVDHRASSGPTARAKSTLLKSHGPHPRPPTGARVAVHGSVSPLLELGTGFHPELTGRENVFLGGSLLGQTPLGRGEPVRRHRRLRRHRSASWTFRSRTTPAGMYARLAFAVAISVDPEILLVDEVLSVGDESFQMRCHRAHRRAPGRGPHHRDGLPQPRHHPQPVQPCRVARPRQGGHGGRGPRRHRRLPGRGAPRRRPAARGLAPSAPAPARARSRSPASLSSTARASWPAPSAPAKPSPSALPIGRDADRATSRCGIAVFRPGNLVLPVRAQHRGRRRPPAPRRRGHHRVRPPSLPLLARALRGDRRPGGRGDASGRIDVQEQSTRSSCLENPALPRAGMVHVDGHWTGPAAPVAA